MHWQIPRDCNAMESCWSELTTWCDQRGAYLGGTFSKAFILVHPAAPSLHRRLRLWLTRQRCIATFELQRTAWAGSTQNPADVAKEQNTMLETDPADLNAKLEALTNYQQHLVEQLAWAVGMLPQLRNKTKGCLP